MKKANYNATSLSQHVNTTELVNIVFSEVDNPTDNTARARARSRLSGYLGEHTPAKTSSLRAYVKEGLNILSAIPECATYEIDQIRYEKDEMRMDAVTARETTLWLRAFSIAARQADIGDFAIKLAEDWLNLNELTPLEPESGQSPDDLTIWL